MRLKNYLFILLTLVFGFSGYAQGSYDVTGNVKGAEDDMPIPGVNVIKVGTTSGTATDFDGNFKLNVTSGDVLEFSSVGYGSKKVTITGQKTINVSLSEDSNTLDEVVVVGYGKRKKSHLTGAIAKVGGEDIAAVQTARVDDALAGKLSGVRIQNTSGEPGAAPTIQIRAASSVSGVSSPLIVVDGYPISGDLSTVNPNDVESMEVLKDAASAAIYGSRGANGVILVTTKKGKSGKTQFNYSGYTSISSKYRKNILPTGSEWADTYESNIENGTFDVSEVDADLLALRTSFYKNSPDTESVEDWLFRNGISQSHNFSMRGGSESAKFFASVGYQDIEGIAITQDFRRYNARLNVDATLGEKFTAGISLNGNMSDRSQLAHNMRDLLRAYSVHPIIHTDESIAYAQQLDAQAQALGLSAFDTGFAGGNADSETEMNSSIYTLEAGDYAHDWHYGGRSGLWGGSSNQGPAAKLFERENTTKEFFINVSSYLQYEIVDGLNIKTVLGGDYRNTEAYNHQLSQADRRGEISRTILNETDTKRSSVLSETTLNFNKKLGKDGKHDVSAVAGVEFQNNYITAISVNGTNLPNDVVLNYNLLTQEDITVTERDEVVTRQSVFGRLNYAYDDRYLFSASLRRDGDSRFGANKRFETFPALSIGWNVHNETFWEPISDVISTFKPRFSYGTLGTTSFLTSYGALSLLNPVPSSYGTAFLIPTDVANPDLTWQTNEETNFGLDLGFVNNRIRLSVDYYTSDITDMLLSQSIPVGLFGQNVQSVNLGNLRSSGLEFEVSAGIVNTDDFSWDVSANLSTVRTEITDLGGDESLPDEQYGVSGRGPVFRNYVGGEIGEMWGLETIGQVEMEFVEDPTISPNITSGESYVVDQNNDGVIDTDDYVKIGQNTPDFYWGMTHNFRYKNFDLSMQFQGSQGGDIYNLDPLYYESQWGGRLRDSFDADDDGIADHNGQFYERNRDQTDSGIQDASFIALRNLTLGYTFDSDLMESVGLSSVRLYTAATNLLYIMGDDYTSYNPEGIRTASDGGDTYKGPITNGVQLGSSPTVRSFTLGLNVNF